MVSVRLLPLDSKIYLDRGHGGMLEEPWTHLLVPPQPFSSWGPLCTHPKPSRRWVLLAVEQKGPLERPRQEEVRPREKGRGTEMGRNKKMPN